MKDYQLIIRVPFKARDDVESRQIAHDMLKQLNTPDGLPHTHEEVIVKLQRVHERSEPSGIKL